MFGDQHPRGEAVSSVAGLDRNLGLAEDRAIVELCGDQMDAAAAMTVTRLQRAIVGVEALVLGQQAGVNVDHPAVPAADEFRRQYPHIARQRDKMRAAGPD